MCLKEVFTLPLRQDCRFESLLVKAVERLHDLHAEISYLLALWRVVCGVIRSYAQGVTRNIVERVS